MPAGNPSGNTPSPKTRELLQLIEQLEHGDRYRDIIRLAESWGQNNPLPREASLAQARAFLSLRLMDRAWVRLRELAESNSDDVEPLLLTSEMFLERGWPARARKVLQRVKRIDPQHRALAELEKRAAAPPLRPPPNARELERQGTPEQLIFLAERYLATGSMLRGKSLLERIRRLQPGNTRVEQLLWGVKGDFSSGRRQSLVDLVAELGGDHSGEWDAVENTESISFADVTAAGVQLSPEAERPDSFPLLFRRRMVIGNGDDDESEVTISARLASPDEMADAPEMENTDPGIAELEDDPDTRIMEVISNRNGEVELVSAVHSSDESPDRQGRQALDLRALSAADSDPETEEGDFLEDEDEDLVVMTRREVSRAPKSSGRVRRSPIEVIEKHPVPAPTPEPPPAQLQDDLEPLESDELTPVRSSRGGLLVVMAGGLMLLATVSAYIGMQYHARGELVDETHAAIAAGEFQALRALEARLNGQVQAGVSPLGVRAVELALLNAVLWADYTGDPEDRKQAESLLLQAEEEGAPAAEIALTQGLLALERGDIDAAAEAAAAADPSHDETRYLKARVLLLQGAPETAMSVWAAEAVPEGERYASIRPLILEQAGQLEKIPPLLAEPGVFLQIVADENRWVAEAPEDRLYRVSERLKEERRSLSPRHRARMLAIQAELNEELEREAAARRSWQQALDTDAHHPSYLYEIASRELTKGRPLDAAERMSRCVGNHPMDNSCQRAYLMALLELDRIDAARDQIAAWESAAGEVMLAKVWLAVAEGRAAAALDMLDGELGENGLAWYLSGLARGHLGDRTAGDELAQASTLLAASEYPELRMLSERARAARVEYGTRSVARPLAATLRTEGALDPVVHLHLGRYFEAAGRRSDATQHFARAGQLAEQNGRVLFELGSVYFGPKTEWAYDLWRRYLELAPSGERAVRTKARLEE